MISLLEGDVDDARLAEIEEAAEAELGRGIIEFDAQRRADEQRAGQRQLEHMLRDSANLTAYAYAKMHGATKALEAPGGCNPPPPIPFLVLLYNRG